MDLPPCKILKFLTREFTLTLEFTLRKIEAR